MKHYGRKKKEPINKTPLSEEDLLKVVKEIFENNNININNDIEVKDVIKDAEIEPKLEEDEEETSSKKAKRKRLSRGGAGGSTRDS